MRRIGTVLGLLLLVVAPAARAAPPAGWQLTYVTYAGGFTTVRLTATLGLSGQGYRLAVAYHTVGLVGFLFPGHDEAWADGSWEDGTAAPVEFQSEGTWSGKPFDVALGYAGATPEVRKLVPDDANKREPVPAALEKNTIDTLSAMALLFQRVANGESCRMAVRVFDGRRLIALEATPAGSESLGPTMRSFFHGSAERCDIGGKMLAGFLRSDGPEERARVHHGTVWFAHPVPGLPLLPVRMAFSTRWFGTAMMYLTDIKSAPGTVPGFKRVALAPARSGSGEASVNH